MESLGVKTYAASDQGFFVISTIVYGETDAVLYLVKRKPTHRLVSMLRNGM